MDNLVDEDLIDEDELLDEADLVKPDASSLRGKFKKFYCLRVDKENLCICINYIINLLFTVCGTTGKRKACKDCTCGLAEELSGKTPQETVVKSSCGNVRFILSLLS